MFVYIIYMRLYKYTYIYAYICKHEHNWDFIYMVFIDLYNLLQALTLDIQRHLSRREACYLYICSHSSLLHRQTICCSQIV